MKRNIDKNSLWFFVLVFFIFSCSSSKKTVQAPAPVVKPPVTTEVKPVVPQKPEPPKQLNFTLLLPLDLKKQFVVDTTTDAETPIDMSALNQLHFLEGAMLAVDSLKHKGININLKTHDTAIDSFSLTNLFYQKDVMASNFIFAAFNTSFYTAAADIAQKHNNKIIFTQPAPSSTIKQNKNVYLAVPTTTTQCALAAEFVLSNFGDAKKFVVNRDIKREKDLAEIFKSKFGTNPVSYLTWSQAKEDSLINSLSKTLHNVIIITSSDEAFVSPFLNKINSFNMANITILGLPTWENFESIDFSSLKNLNIDYFSSMYFDAGSASVSAFRKKFLSTYNTGPMNSAFLGFELVNYFAKQMMDEKKPDEFSLSLLPFKFLNDTPENGFENKTIHILQVKEYAISKKN